MTLNPINQFLANVLILFPLKTTENLSVFRGIKWKTLARNGLIKTETYEKNYLKVNWSVYSIALAALLFPTIKIKKFVYVLLAWITQLLMPSLINRSHSLSQNKLIKFTFSCLILNVLTLNALRQSCHHVFRRIFTGQTYILIKVNYRYK